MVLFNENSVHISLSIYPVFYWFILILVTCSIAWPHNVVCHCSLHIVLWANKLIKHNSFAFITILDH